MNKIQLLKSQEHIWLLNNLIPGNQAFNVYNSYLITGELHIDLLRLALQTVAEKFSSLRTYFDYQNGEVSPFIQSETDFNLPFRTIEVGRSFIENEEYDELNAELNRSFDLSHAPLFSVSLFIFAEDKKILTFVYNRIIVDATSARYISELAGKYYSEICKNNKVPIDTVPDYFPEIVTKINEWANTKEHAFLLENWSANYPDPNEKVELPADYRNLPKIDLQGLRVKLKTDNEIFCAADAYSQQNLMPATDLYIVAFGILLHRLSNQDSIIIGLPFSLTDENTNVTGNLENTLPVRLDFSNSPNLTDLLKQLRENIAFQKNHHKVLYASIINHSKTKKDLLVNPFYQTSFSYTSSQQPEFNSIPVREIFSSRMGSRLDLSFDLVKDGSDFILNAEYNTAKFSETSISRWVSIYQLILQGILSNSLLPVDELDIIPSTDLQQLTIWNETDVPYENQSCIHSKLEEHALHTPEAIALRWGDKTLTYDEFNRQVNKLANYILSIQDVSHQIIGVCMERSPEMMICIYAILKAGAAYLPIDASSPTVRSGVILEDAKPVIVFVKSGSVKSIPEGNYTIIKLDNLLANPLSEKDTNPSVNIPSDSLAYIIYTSGSTGNPKGVMIQHHSVMNRIGWMQKQYNINSGDILIQKTPVTFDVSVWELFWWTFTGASLVLLAPGAEKEPSLLSRAIEKYKVTVIHFVPSMFNAFRAYVDAFKEQSRIRSLATVFLSGEALSADSVNDFYLSMGTENIPVLVNLYGPTEATVDVSYYDCPKTTDNERIYIGKPIDNTKLLVVNRKNKIQPIGVTGELVIAGVNLAKGYLNRPELNKEKFIEICGLDKENSLRVYKTGDIAKWTESAVIDYIGRVDDQVKIRGFRIEPGEIEAKIMEFRGVESCSVIINRHNPDNPLLVAYIKTLNHLDPDINSLQAFLTDRLPSYMIPTSFIPLPEMPLTSSGKINRKALTEFKPSPTNHKRQVLGEIENIILTVWQDVLKMDHIDITTNFFDIGGNSIMIPLIAARLQKEYSLKVNTTDIFQYPTVESLSSFIKSTADGSSKITELADAMKKEQRSTNGSSDIRIAIIGMAGRFPEADTKEEFWEKLCGNTECLRFFSDDILEKHDTTYEVNKNNPDYIKSRGILNNIEMWDPKFFGFSPHDARYTDPQQRIWFETVWNALEDAGCDPYSYKGDIGVFAGVNLNSYLFDNILRNRKRYEDYMHFSDAETFHTYVNNDPAFIATRTAYLFNLRGPAINVQTACSTSLTAITMACNSLINGESDMAIAGASSIQTPQEIGYIYQPGGMRSSDGHCRPFDKNGSGTVFSNAVGAVVLKRLDDAERDNDEIYGVIKGWAINNDGNDKVGFAAPSVNGQLDLLRKAFIKANVHPEEICYIEAHGTGTIMGDPIEASALIQAFREKTSKKQFCGLGSVKGNIGHTDEVAGIMGFIKVALAARYKKIPATINYFEPNPNIDFEKSPFYVVDKPIDWDNNKPMIMGVTSLGVGGTNVHVIIEDYHKDVKTGIPENQNPQIIVASAKSTWSLEKNIDNLVDFMNNNSTEASLSDICYTTQLRRTHWQNRAFAIISGDRKLAKTDFITGSHSKKIKKTVFLFPGQGAQFLNMGIALYNHEPLFREILDKGFAIYKQETQSDLKTIVFNNPSNDEDLLNNTQYTQPALLIISYAVAKLYEQYGIMPDESIGHSIGEYVSACISGVFDFETALKIVIKRGKLMQSVPRGSMMAVRASIEELEEIRNSVFEIGAVNAPQSCTISFKTDRLGDVEKILNDHSIAYVPLKTSHAFHSSQVDIILEEFEEFVNQFNLHPPKLPFISCVTGDYADKNEITKGSYWAKQLRVTVQFDKGITAIQNNSDCVFIESGPNTHLSGLTRQNLGTTKKTKIIPTIGTDVNGNTYEAFLQSIGHIWMAGITPDFRQFHRERSPKMVKTPDYAFEKKRYWIDIDRNKLKDLIDRETLISLEIEQDTDYADSDSKAIVRADSNLTDTERTILEIWEQSIGTTEIELNDNFFELGGHSLLAVQILSKIKEKLHADIEIVDLFEYPTVKSLSEFLTSGKNKKAVYEDVVSDRMQKRRDVSGSQRDKRRR